MPIMKSCKISLSMITLTLFAGCYDIDNSQTTPTKTAIWESVFSDRIDVTPKLSNELNPLGNIKTALPLDSILVTTDAINDRIIISNYEGNVIQVIGGSGGGPGEYQHMSAVAVDDDGTIYVFDVAGYRVQTYKMSHNRYEWEEEYSLSRNAIRLRAVNGQLLTYTLSDDDLLALHDQNGDIVYRGYNVSEEVDLRLRLFRFKGGGFDVNDNEMIYAIYPGKYQVTVFDMMLNPVDTLLADEENKWRPSAPEPPNTSPYGYTGEDKKWFESFIHIGRLLFVSDNIFCIWLYEQDGEGDYKMYVNLYTIEGEVINEGIALPAGERIIGAGNGYIYTATEAKIQQSDAAKTEESEYVISDAKMYQYKYGA